MPSGLESGKTWSPIGAQATVSTDAASRVWTLNEVAAYEGAGTWPAPPEQFELLSSTTVSSATQSVTFSSIPQTHRDLRLVIRAAHYNVYNELMWIQLNGDSTASNYRLYFFGTTKSGTAAGSGSWDVVFYNSSVSRMPYGDFPQGSNSRGSFNERQAAEFQIPRYTETSSSRAAAVYCIASSTNNFANPGTGSPVFYQWTGMPHSGTSACTSITVYTSSSGTDYLLQPGTSMSLYGIGEAP